MLLAGAVASVFGGLLFQKEVFGNYLVYGLWALGIITILLFLYGANLFSHLWYRINLIRRKGNILFSPKIGILNDMAWGENTDEICAWAKINPQEWKKKIINLAKQNSFNIEVKLINSTTNFDSFIAILNPYGGVYPEYDLVNYATLNKIFRYVDRGGMFINVADIPGYYAYNAKLKRRLETTPVVYGENLIKHRPFERTPLMEKLGIRILNIEQSSYSLWNVKFENKYSYLNDDFEDLKIHRAARIERNIESIIRAKKGMTPLFYVKYGEGKFLFSLIFFHPEHAQNDKLGNIICEIIVNYIDGVK